MQVEGAATVNDARFDHVPRGARFVIHQSARLVQQRIEEGALAGVGRADEDHLHALAQQASRTGVGEQGFRPRQGFVQDGQALAGRGLRCIVLAEFETALQLGEQRQQGRLEIGHVTLEGAAELAQGALGGEAVLRGDQVRHGLGLVEAQAPVQKGASRELAGAGRPRPRRQAGLDHQARGQPAAVAVELHHVLAGVGMGRQHGQHQDLVEVLAGARIARDADKSTMGGQLDRRAAVRQEGDGDLRSARPAQAHHGQAALPFRGGDGRDRVLIGAVVPVEQRAAPDRQTGRPCAPPRRSQPVVEAAPMRRPSPASPRASLPPRPRRRAPPGSREPPVRRPRPPSALRPAGRPSRRRP